MALIKPFHFEKNVSLKGFDANGLISRSGYTGEDGFEMHFAPQSAAKPWKIILEHGEGEGMTPARLGARDPFRFETGLPLYGEEYKREK